MRAPLLALSVTTLCLCAPAGAQTVLNGSFEEPVVTSGYFLNVASSFSGWTLNYGDVDTVREFGGSGWAPQAGSQSLDLNGFNAGSITQNVGGFTVGNEYVLTYYYNGTNVGGQKTSLTFLGGTTSLGATIETVATADNIWQERQIQFTALNPTVGITFASLNSGNQGMAIDNVSITAVPEPHEWAMMLAGLGLVGWAARRNRKQGAGPAFAAA